MGVVVIPSSRAGNNQVWGAGWEGSLHIFLFLPLDMGHVGCVLGWRFVFDVEVALMLTILSSKGCPMRSSTRVPNSGSTSRNDTP